MNHQRLFGDKESSPLWAVTGVGSSHTEGIRIPSESVAIVVVSEGSADWSNGEKVGESLTSPTTGVAVTAGGELSLTPSEDSKTLVVGFSRAVFSGLVDQFREELSPELYRALMQKGSGSRSQYIPVVAPISLFARIVPEFLEPIPEGAARSFWYEGQIRLLVSLVCFRQPGRAAFEEDEQAMRDAMQRVNKTKQILGDQLERSPGLPELAGHVGCSATHLCRTFSRLTGMTISQYLRRRRIMKATELLGTLDTTVGDVARKVGYRSISHFTKAFVLEKGYLPSEVRRA